MPTLPERATSILAVLSHAAPDAPLPLSSPDSPSFDWQALVQEKKPGARTDTQRQQAQRVQRVRAALQDWAESLGLPFEHVEESALYAVVSTDPTTPDTRALALGMIVLWIYLLDDYLDRRDVATLASSSFAAADLATLDRDLRAMLSPLAGAAGWPSPRRTGAPAQGSHDAARLARALAAVLDALAAEWARLPGGRWRLRVRRALVARHIAECVSAMRHELLWNVAYARQRRGTAALPAFDDYLRNGTVSIGMPAVAAAAASLEDRPRHAWRAAQLAITAGGAIVRLTNDLHTYFADVEEGKITSVTIRRWALGDVSCSSDAESSPGVLAAQTSLTGDLFLAIAAFGQFQAALPDGPLAYCVRHAVAFALAVYGDGSRYRQRAA